MPNQPIDALYLPPGDETKREPFRPPSRRARHIECTLTEYHARKEWSNSQLAVLYQSPPLFHGMFIANIYPRKQSHDLDVGIVAHQVLTHPGDFEEIVAVIPPDVLNRQGYRKGKAWLEWLAEHADKIQMTAREVAPVRHMVQNVYAHPIAGPLLALAMNYEFTLVYNDDETGLPLRARPDVLVGQQSMVIILDYKTTRAVTPREFGRQAAQYGYHRQAAWYWEAAELFGYTVARFLFVTSDKSPAHQCRVYELPRAAIELGREENRYLRHELARRLSEDDWSDPLDQDVLTVNLPEWAYSEAGPPLTLKVGGQTLVV